MSLASQVDALATRIADEIKGFKGQSITVVVHGNDAAFPRPAGATAVYWLGDVQPTNMTAADIYNGPAA